MAKEAGYDWTGIEGDYRAGVLTGRAIARKYGCSESAIRKKAEKNGWVQDPTGTVRERVKANLAGAGAQDPAQDAARTMEAAAKSATDDMTDALKVARKALRRCEAVVDALEVPRDIKAISEAIRTNVDTIRRIRGLDDPLPPPNDGEKTVFYLPDNLRDGQVAP